MSIRLLLFLAIALVAIAAGVAVSHVLRWPVRREVSALPIARLQISVRRFGLILGVVEVAALIALLIVLFTVPVGTTTMWLVAAAAVCVAAMIGVWAAWLRPMNATIAAWLPKSLPSDWKHHHARWTRLHRARAILAVIALVLLLIGLMAHAAE
ncbi:MAG TPA: anthrone oxygenase family protein [Gemmatimonadaceae bacterium]|jgi:hypothetical protein